MHQENNCRFKRKSISKRTGRNFLKVLKRKFGNSYLPFVEKNLSEYLVTNLDKKFEIGNKGLFTKEIDEAQLRSEIDIAVHS